MSDHDSYCDYATGIHPFHMSSKGDSRLTPTASARLPDPSKAESYRRHYLLLNQGDSGSTAKA